MSQLRMRRVSLSALPGMPLIEPGYVLRSYQEQDLDGLATLLAQAFADDTWNTERVRRDLIDAPDVRRTMLVVCEEKPVATASVQVVSDAEGETGYVHWVAAHPDHGGKRLGYIVTLAVLRELATLGFTNAALITDDHRLPAIYVYKQLGFVPEHTDETHPARWEAVEVGLRR